jgi:hypothetical protein
MDSGKPTGVRWPLMEIDGDPASDPADTETAVVYLLK